MSKNLMIGLLVAGITLGVYLYSQPKQDSMVQDDAMMVQDLTVNKEDAMMAQPSRYIPFTPSVLADTASTRRVLYFYASWCPTCIPANADFEKNQSMLPSDVTVIRVNYNDPDTDDDEKSLADKYDITYQHTFVQLDSEGGVVTKWNGGATKELLGKIK